MLCYVMWLTLFMFIHSTSDASRKKMKLEAAKKAAEEAAQRVADAEKDSENVKDEL